MGLKNGDSQLTHSGSKPQPSIVHDSLGAFIKITCGNYSGNLYLAKLDESNLNVFFFKWHLVYSFRG